MDVVVGFGRHKWANRTHVATDPSGPYSSDRHSGKLPSVRGSLGGWSSGVGFGWRHSPILLLLVALPHRRSLR
jgi:hypothetical protein